MTDRRTLTVTCPADGKRYTIVVTPGETFTCPGCGKIGHAARTTRHHVGGWSE